VRCAERDNLASGSPVSKRYFDRGILVGAQSYYYVSDRLGSVRQLIDPSGATLARYDYDPYGNLISSPTTIDNDVGYAGYLHHAASGLDFALFRAYDPAHARWLNRDPIGVAGGFNLYAYVAGNPVFWMDRSGETPAGLAAGAALGGAIGGWIGGVIGAGTGAIIAIPTGPGEVVAIPVGGALGAGGGFAVGSAIGGFLGDTLSNINWHTSDGSGGFTDVPSNQPPFTGDPGSTVRGGTGSRTYGPDGYPQTDRDLPHPDEAGTGNDDHCHDWGRPPNGGPPTNDDRGPPRVPQPGDPPPPRGPNVPPP
jgi:RHS repeat-associated protein